MKKKLFKIIFIATGVTYFFNLVYGILSFRTMLSEGAFWFYTILTQHAVFSDLVFYRHINYLIQAPAVIFLKSMSFLGFSNLESKGALLLSFGWQIQYTISLCLCWYILSKKNKKEMIFFPLLSLAAACMPVIPYGVCLMLPAANIFWPALLLSLFVNRKSLVFDSLLLGLLLFLLAISYEGSILFFSLLISIYIYDIVTKKNRPDLLNYLLIVLCVIFSMWLVYVSTFANSQITGSFIENLFKTPFSKFQIFGVLMTLFFYIALYSDRLFHNFRRFKTILFFLALLSVLGITSFLFNDLVLYFTNEAIPNNNAHAARLFGIFFVFSIGLMASIFVLFFHDENKYERITETKIIVVFALFVALIIDTGYIKIWSDQLKTLRQVVYEQVGCFNLTNKEFMTKFDHGYIPTFAVPYHSLMIQIIDGKESFESVVIASQSFDNACNSMDSEVLKTDQGYQIHFNLSKVPFEFITQKM